MQNHVQKSAVPSFVSSSSHASKIVPDRVSRDLQLKKWLYINDRTRASMLLDLALSYAIPLEDCAEALTVHEVRQGYTGQAQKKRLLSFWIMWQPCLPERLLTDGNAPPCLCPAQV